MKVHDWMKPIFKYFVPVAIIALYVIGLREFQWK
jgi:hypothetical protein